MTKFIDPGLQKHLDRMFAATFNTYNLQDAVRYIEEKTYLAGQRFSFKHHEFQQDILSDTSKTVYVQKCAQVGMSEAMARYALATCRIIPYFSVILTMPYGGDIAKFIRTRLDPIIQGSPDIQAAIGTNVDNTENKILDTSIIHARGTSGDTAALSVPADLLIHDEVDRSNADTIAQYQSRLKHSDWGLTRLFGTPTVDGVGIAKAMSTARRKRHMVKCNHCNEWFVPSYHTHIHVPGWDKPLREITKYNLPDLNYRDATFNCPKCGKEPSLWPDRREWVFENPSERWEAIGYYVIPFSLPKICTPSYLIKESTKYGSWSEFCNQALGETNNEESAQLLELDLQDTMSTVPLESSEMHAIGADMGQTCYITVGRMLQDGMLLVVHREKCSLIDFRTRIAEIKRKFRVLVSVYDFQPYTDLVISMQKSDKNLYGCQYQDAKSSVTFEIKRADENKKEGKLPITLVRMQRNLNFDEVLTLFKQRRLLWTDQGEIANKEWIDHCLDMTRVQKFDKHHEMVFDWVKSSKGEDHYMHALGYLHVACRLMPTASATFPVAGVPMIQLMNVTYQSPQAAALAKRT
jgi:hypothetical protein